MYADIKRYFDLLDDDRSKEIFLARLNVDLRRTKENMDNLSSFMVTPPLWA